MAYEKLEMTGIVLAAIITAINFIMFYETKTFSFLVGLAVLAVILPFLMNLIKESKKEKEKEEMFIEFARDLSESVHAGTPISKSIINLANRDYRSLSPHINKLANQLSLAIPLKQVFKTFASDINNKVVSRSVEMIIGVESFGGNIASALDSVVKNVREIEDISKERHSRVYSMIVQGYIIFFIFVFIMLFVEIKFIPLMSGIPSGISTGAANINIGGNMSTELIKRSFFILLMVQAAFAGLVIGKLSEGMIKKGIKHSIILLVVSFLAISATRAFI